MKKIVPAPYIDQTARWVNGCESISSVMLLPGTAAMLPASCRPCRAR